MMNSAVTKNNIRYSIDKVKIEFMYIKTLQVQQFINILAKESSVMYSFESKKCNSCKYNYKISCDNGYIYLGIIPNWEKESKNDKNIVLEYNPNKVDPYTISYLEFLARIPKSSWRIMSFDIACDIYVAYSNVRMLKRDKREYMSSIGHSEIETRYLGIVGNNHIKLYNKAKEQKLKNKNWTRFEITIKGINNTDCNLEDFKNTIKLPTLYLVNSQLNNGCSQLKVTTEIVLEAIINDTNLLNRFPSRTRKKYENLLSQFLNSIDLDIALMYEIYITYFQNI